MPYLVEKILGPKLSQLRERAAREDFDILHSLDYTKKKRKIKTPNDRPIFEIRNS
jgi:hypothetical protein